MTMSSEQDRERADIGGEMDRLPTNFLDSFVDRECNRRLIVRSKFLRILGIFTIFDEDQLFLWLLFDFIWFIVTF
jgi:hypothetical protein